jgi:ribosomal 50S subunit-associated protein YjgA (DUF615 family)
MHPSQILAVKEVVLDTSRRSALQLAARVLRATDPATIRAMLERAAPQRETEVAPRERPAPQRERVP